MAINRYPYTCTTCGASLSKGAMRIRGASVYCNWCYISAMGDAQIKYPTLPSTK